jgi:DNA replicative helicase MCM subunit Mcm2 (Cdc46/Mcm family)
MGSVPRSIPVLLEADLADKFNAGDDVLVVGFMVRRWAPVARGMRCSVDIAIRANRCATLQLEHLD